MEGCDLTFLAADCLNFAAVKVKGQLAATISHPKSCKVPVLNNKMCVCVHDRCRYTIMCRRYRMSKIGWLLALSIDNCVLPLSVVAFSLSFFSFSFGESLNAFSKCLT